MAKDLICKSCNNKWYVDEELLKQVKLCPFCATEYIHEKEKIIIDSVDKAIYATICEAGIEILLERNRFLAYLNDMASDYRKEIKILSKACEPKILSAILEASKQEYTDAVITMKTVEVSLIDDEGMSDKWAQMICDWFFKAIRYGKDSVTTQPSNKTKTSSEGAQTKEKKQHINNRTKVEIINSKNAPKVDRTSVISDVIKKIDYPETSGDVMSNWLKKQKTKNNRLEELVINSNVSTILEEEFCGKKFSWLIIGSKVKKISREAFFGCGIQMVYIPSTVEVIEEYAFGNNDIAFILFEDSTKIQKIASNAFNNRPKAIYEHYKEPCIACSKENQQIRNYCAENRLKHILSFSPETVFYAHRPKKAL